MARRYDALGRAYAADPACRIEVDADHRALGHQRGEAGRLGRIDEVRGSQHGLDLHVLRIEDAADEVSGDFGFVVRQLTGRNRLGDHAAGALLGGESQQVVMCFLSRCDDQPALRVELERITE